jgi:hypothetical protein
MPSIEPKLDAKRTATKIRTLDASKKNREKEKDKKAASFFSTAELDKTEERFSHLNDSWHCAAAG